MAVFRPQAILIGGGISNEGERLLGPLDEKLFQCTYGAREIGVPPVIRAGPGSDAGIVGAALLELSEQDGG